MDDEEFEETLEERMETRFLATHGTRNAARPSESGFVRDHDWAKDAIECDENDPVARRMLGLPRDTYQEGGFI